MAMVLVMVVTMAVALGGELVCLQDKTGVVETESG